MIDLIRAEFLKLRSTRTALGLFIAALAISVIPAILAMALLPHELLTEEEGSVAVAALGLFVVPMLTVVFGILGMTNEYRHGTITYTYLATPRRGLVIVAKLFCYAIIGIAVIALTALLVVAVIGAIAAIRNVPTPWLSLSSLGDLEVLRDIALFIGTVGLMTAFGVGLGALFRAQVVTVAGVLIWALVLEGIVSAFKPRIGMFLPFSAFQHLNVGGLQSGEVASTLTRPQAFLVGVAYIAAVSIAAVFISMRRDVT